MPSTHFRTCPLCDAMCGLRITVEDGVVHDIRGDREDVLSRGLMPGVASLPHGFGHQEAADTLRVAGALEGANVNTLTDDQWVDPVLGDSILNGIPVEIRPRA